MTPRMYTIDQTYELNLLALVVWREARGEIVPAKNAVAWSIRNRVMHPSWWGTDWISVILKPLQYSSFNHGDPNSTKWPLPLDQSWMACQEAAEDAYASVGVDPVSGATHYYDTSIAAPLWAQSDTMTHVLDVGHLKFWKHV